ncbi:MazG family protein [Gulosibacter faecalis]|jgi:XTP/dITP diphosphohydrolase|uniref:MazG family protein n=1 Tax=Gulosibacter faecalis TaxID=272240 RepID=A0ABW5UY11_9MICO|nr:MazG family protein [Gulosibacter faecalis]
MANDEVQRLIDTVERFRGEHGCAWFEEQTHRSLAKYLVEESAELIDAIETDNDAEMREELGDVLFQVLFHANVAAHRGAFTLDDVARDQTEKLLRRNPHVFGATPTRDIGEIIAMWEEAKAIEKRDRTSVLDGVSHAMPALALAQKVLGRASGLEVDTRGPESNDPEEALGALLLTAVAAAREAGLDAERALRGAIRGLESRIRDAEQSAGRGVGNNG